MAYSIAKSIFKNTAALMSAQVITWSSGFVLLLILPRYLGSAGYGKLYIAMSMQTILQFLIDYGGTTYIPKEVARDRGRSSDLVSHSIILRIGLWGISVVIAMTWCMIAKYPISVILLVMVLAISNLWGNICALLRSCFQGFEEMKYPSIASVVERSFLMLTTVPLLLLGARETAVVTMMAISTFISFAIHAKYVTRLIRIKLSIHLETARRLLREGLPYFLSSLFGVVYYRIDAIMLSVMTPEKVVGWYGAAYRFFDILMFLPSIYATTLFPILSKLSKSEFSSMKNTSTKSLEILLVAGIPIAVGLIFFAKQIVQILYGLPEFGPSIAVLQIFSFGMLLVYVDFVLGSTAMALDKQKQWALVAFGAIFVNMASNYYLIPYFQTSFGNGGIGSAIATDLTEFFIMISAIYLVPKSLFTKRLFLVAAKGFFSGIAMGVTIWGGELLGVPWIILTFIGAVTYVTSLVVLTTFEPSEVAYVLNAISVRNFKRILLERKGAGA